MVKLRILGIDPGEKNIGVAISDPTGTLARPLAIIPHISRRKNAERILEIASSEGVQKIIIGQATDLDGLPNFSGRKAARLAAEIRTLSELCVELWDESSSTKQALQSKLKFGSSQKNRQGHLDDIAASIILQSYLDLKATSQSNETHSP